MMHAPLRIPTDVPTPAALTLVHPLRLGSLRATPYGLCAAVGLLVAMGWVRRAARHAGLDPEIGWDAGMFAILGCFFASRLLLVLRDPLAFLHYPLLVLSLPSLTYGGMAAASLMLLAYLRRRRLALWPLLDAFTPPAALFAAFLEIGHALDGSEAGTPSTLPWAMRSEAHSAVRVHPVAAYGALAAMLLAATTWHALKQTQAAGRVAGRVAALGLMLGGTAAFLLDMVTQPVFPSLDLALEPGQWIALAAMLAGALLWTFAPQVNAATAPQAKELAPLSRTGIGTGHPLSSEVR